MNSKKRLNRHTLAGIAAIVLWSTTVSLARSISEQIGSLTTIATVYLTGGILLLSKEFGLKQRTLKRLKLSPPKHFWICGSLFLIYTSALFLALGLAGNRMQVLEIGLVNYLWTAFNILFSILFFPVRVRWFLGLATLLAVAGITLVVTQGADISLGSFLANIKGNPLAYGLGLIAALTWGLYSNLTRLLAGSRQENSVPFFILITGGVLLVIRLFNPEAYTLDLTVLVEIAALGISTALAYVFWDIAMRKGNSTLVASCAYLTPLLSTLVGSFYLQVIPGAQLWIGCLLIIAGSYLSWKSVLP